MAKLAYHKMPKAQMKTGGPDAHWHQVCGESRARPRGPDDKFSYGKDVALWLEIGGSLLSVPAKSFALFTGRPPERFVAKITAYVQYGSPLADVATDHGAFSLRWRISSVDSGAIAFVVPECRIARWSMVVTGRCDAVKLRLRIASPRMPQLV